MNTCKKSEWSRMDRMIAQAEKEELRRMQASEDTLENYFEAKRRTELSRKKLSEMSWQEVHELHELRKASADIVIRKNAAENEFQEPEDMQKEIMKMVDQCELAASKSKPELVESFRRLKILLEKVNNINIAEGQEDENAQMEEEISSEEPVSVSKSAGLKICKATRTVSGYASCSNVDVAGDRITAEALENMMPAYMSRGGVLAYGHLNGSVGKVLEWKMVNLNGNPAIYIKAKIFDDYQTDNNIWRDIVSGKINAFSIGGIGYKHSQKCNKDGCYREIPQIDLLEISLCDNPLNPEAKIMEVR